MFRKNKTEVQAKPEDSKNAFYKSIDSFKEIGTGFVGTLRTRADKATDSPYDFFNWLTLGITGDIPVGIYEAAKDRSEHMFDSKEKFADWLTLGTVEMAKGAFNPDEAWSADHWLNSLGMVTLLYGPVEKSLLPTGSGGLKPTKGLDSVKDFEVKKPLPAFSTNEGFQFKINNLDVDTPALPQTPMQINFKNEMDRILREKMEGKSESNHSIKDVEVKAVEGTGEGKRASGKDVYGPYYDEAKKLHESNPDWYPNPDESIVVKGEELKQARADYEALVRRGELEKGHHVQGLSFGGENVDSNIKITGESTIRREKLEDLDLDLDFYHEMGYGKENAKVLKIFQNKNGIILFGNNPTHTEVTVFQNKILKWLRDNGKR